MQLQPHRAHPFHEGGQHPMGLGLADAVHHCIIHVAFEPDPGNSRVIQTSNA